MAIVDTIWTTISSLYTILKYGWPFMILAWIVILKVKWKNWPLEAVIIERRGNNLVKTNDRCGKYTEPFSKLISYKLMYTKDTIPIINFDWILHNVVVPTTIFDRLINLLRGNIGTIFLFKYGTKQYKPINIIWNGQRRLIYKELKDKSGKPIYIQMYEQFDPRKHLGALDFQVIDWDNMNFMVQEQRASFERRQKKKDFWKGVVIPIVIIAAAALVSLFMLKFGYDSMIALKGADMPNTQNVKTGTGIPVVSELIPAS